MHYLDRSQVAAPTCLSRYQHGRDAWEALARTKADYGQVTDALDALQGGRCAYCEGLLGHAHVDHFEQRSENVRRTFDWGNLFRSCLRDDSCGRYKDRQTYACTDLIKPDVDDPEDFFRFQSDGSIATTESLSARDAHRARTTLRVLSLDAVHGPLRQSRQAHVQGYVQTGLEILDLAQQLGADARVLIEAEVAQTRHLPYATAIKHVLTPPGF